MSGFTPPIIPWARLDDFRALAAAHDGGIVDLSVGSPCDPPSAAVVEALAASNSERGYPSSVGTPAFRAAASSWIARRFGVSIDPSAIASCIGSKEFVATTSHWLHLRSPDRDTVLYPAVSYPTYEMGALLAGLRAVRVPVDDQWRIDVSQIDPADAQRALCLWVNSPSNPTGAVDDLRAVAAWGRDHEVLVISDECYAEFTWDASAQTILDGDSRGVLAVHSLSKRSNVAGLRAGFYAGDPDLVRYLSEVRQHAGFMIPGPIQAAAVVALDDECHVALQKERYRRRLESMVDVLESLGIEAPFPAGGFYLWVPAPEGDAWAFVRTLAERGGALIAPGEFYGPLGNHYVRIAVVQPEDRIALVGDRLRG